MKKIIFCSFLWFSFFPLLLAQDNCITLGELRERAVENDNVRIELDNLCGIEKYNSAERSSAPFISFALQNGTQEYKGEGEDDLSEYTENINGVSLQLGYRFNFNAGSTRFYYDRHTFSTEENDILMQLFVLDWSFQSGISVGIGFGPEEASSIQKKEGEKEEIKAGVSALKLQYSLFVNDNFYFGGGSTLGLLKAKEKNDSINFSLLTFHFGWQF